MQLDYLLFDFTDEDDGSGSFDAMASVPADRLPALLGEVEAVLRWAHRGFGAPSAPESGGDWDFALHAATDAGTPLRVAYDVAREAVSIDGARDGRTTLTLTVAGSRPFRDSLREAFPGSGV